MTHRALGRRGTLARRGAALAVAILAVAALGACSSGSISGKAMGSSSGGPTGSPAAVLQLAADHTATIKTAHITMTQRVTGGPVNATTTITGDIDKADQRSHIRTTVRGLELELVRDHDDYFVRVGGEGPWTHVKLSSDALQKVRDELDPGGSALAMLKNLGVGITKAGTAKVDGATTTHYAGPLDWSTLVDKIAGAGIVPQKAVQALQRSGTKGTGTVDAYVDDQNRVRRVEMAVKLTVQGQELHLQSRVDYTELDEPVHITVPTASQLANTESASTVADLGAIVAQLASSVHGA